MWAGGAMTSRPFGEGLEERIGGRVGKLSFTRRRIFTALRAPDTIPDLMCPPAVVCPPVIGRATGVVSEITTEFGTDAGTEATITSSFTTEVA